MNNFNKTGTKAKMDPDSKRNYFPSPPKTSNGLRDSSNGVKQFPAIGFFNMTNNSTFDIVKLILI
jgi:hypothetical protein